MGAGGDFRDNPAKGFVEGGLARDFRRQDFRSPTNPLPDDRGCGVVAACLDA